MFVSKSQSIDLTRLEFREAVSRVTALLHAGWRVGVILCLVLSFPGGHLPAAAQIADRSNSEPDDADLFAEESDSPGAKQEVVSPKASRFASLESPEGNFRMRPPGPVWERWADGKAEGSHSIGYTYHKYQMKMGATAQVVGEALEVRPEALVGQKKRWFLDKGADEASIRSRPLRLADKYDGHLVAGMLPESTGQMIAMHWIYVHNGMAYDLFATAPARVQKRLAEQALAFWASFEIIDLERRFASKHLAKLTEYTSEDFGIRFLPQGDPWFVAKGSASTVQLGAVIAKRQSGAALAVTSYHLRGTRPSPVALRNAALAISLSPELRGRIKRGRRLKVGEFDASRYSALADISQNSPATECVLVFGPGQLHVVAVMSMHPEERIAEIMDEVLASLQLSKFAQPELAELSPFVADRHANLFNQIGLFYFGTESYEESAAYFQLGNEMRPEDTVILQNLGEAAIMAGKPELALGTYQRSTLRMIRDTNCLARYGWLLAESDRGDEAVTAYRRAIRLGYRELSHIQYFVELLTAREEYEDALAVVKACRNDKDQLELGLMQANVLSAKGDHAAAVEAVLEVRREYDFNPDVEFALMDAYAASGRFQDKLAVADALIAAGVKTANAYYQKGDAELQVKRYKQAKVSLEKALELAPESDVVKNTLRHVAGMLGRGDNSLLKAAIEPVKIPRSLARAPLEEWSPAEARELGAYYTRRFTAYDYDGQGILRTTEYFAARIVNDDGVAIFDTIERTFNPLNEDVYVNALRVRDDKGEVQILGKVEDYYVIDQSDDTMATHDKVVHVPVPGLKAGYQLEFMMTRMEAAEPFPYRRHLFTSGLPVQQHVVLIRCEPGLFQAKTVNQLTRTESPGLTYFEVRNNPPYRWEPRQGLPDRFLPVLYLGSGARTWSELAAEYHQAISDRLPATDRVRKGAQKITDGVEAASEKVARLAGFVQKNLAYQAIEFGRRGRIPSTTAKILENRYGDCKDHSLLLYQLLNEAGVPARLALANTSDKIQPDFPSLEQFDHMIVYLPDLQGGRFLDCTDKTNDMALPVPFGLEKRSVLVLDPEKPRFVSIGDYREEDFVIESERTARPQPGGALDVQEKVIFHRYLGGWIRNHLQSQTADDQKSTLQAMMASAGQPVELRVYRAENVKDYQQSLVLHLQYRINGALHETDDLVVGKLPAIWEHYFFTSTFVEQRRTPFEISAPLTLHSRVLLERTSEFPDVQFELAQPGGNQFARWSVRLGGRQDDGVRLETSATRLAGEHDAGAYAGFHRTMERLRGGVSPALKLRRAP